MRITIIIIATVSILFLIVSQKSFGMIADTSELFKIYSNISNTIAFFIPLTVFIFCLLTSNLMFTVLDEIYDPKKMARIIAISFTPVILNCVIFLIILYDISIGLKIGDMYYINFIAWGCFYLIFTILTKENFEMNFLKAVAISIVPSLIVIGGKLLIS